MAWQYPSSVASNGMTSGNVDGNPAPQGTEYSLQGVMRFLQVEWHRHERDRNIWEIERAEMKGRIGVLEGSVRTNKRIHEALGKHVRILEIALRHERERTKKLAAGQQIDVSRDPKDVARESLDKLPYHDPMPYDSKLSKYALSDDRDPERKRDHSRNFLRQCADEVFYHVHTAAHPPLDLTGFDLNQGLSHNQVSRQSFDNAHFQQQQQQQQQQQSQQPPRRYPPVEQQSQIQHPQDHAMVRDPSVYSSPHTSEVKTFPEQSREALERSTVEQDPVTYAPSERTESPASQAWTMLSDRTNQSNPSANDGDEWNFDEPSAPELEDPPTVPRRPDIDEFPSANLSHVGESSVSHRRKSSGARRRSEVESLRTYLSRKHDSTSFKVKFALRGHLDVVRSVIFTGGGSPSEPEICSCGDDGTIKRWVIPSTFDSQTLNNSGSTNDLDITSYFTHRGHTGAVLSLAACPPSPNFASGGRALGDGWIFSGGQDAAIKVWERGRVDPKATLEGHTDAVWALTVLPGTTGSVFGDRASHYGGNERILLASGAADGRILIWAVSAPPQLNSPQTGSRTRASGRRANSISSGSNFPSSPQPSTATSTPIHYVLIHQISRPGLPRPTSISPLSLAGINFVVSYTNASIVVYDTRSGEELAAMASQETYDGTPSTAVNTVIGSSVSLDDYPFSESSRYGQEQSIHGATGTVDGVEGLVISGSEDQYIRLFDANSGQCTYGMLAHPAAISSLSLSPDGKELVSAGHDASLRFWSLRTRSCVQEVTSHRSMRGEGVCSVVWSQDSRWIVSGGGDGVVKVFSR